MKIRSVTADWLQVPIPEAQQHTTDLGRIASFDSALVSSEILAATLGLPVGGRNRDRFVVSIGRLPKDDRS